MRNLNGFHAFALLSGLSLLISGCSDTAPTNNYFQFGSDATNGSSGAANADASETGSDDPFGDYLRCPDGWQPNSSGDACAPLCADGTKLNAAENGCEPVSDEFADASSGTPVDTTTEADVSGPTEDTEGTPSGDNGDCPPGTVPSTVDGVTVCLSEASVTVAGVVTDSETGEGIEGVMVSMGPLTAEPLMTGTSGHFSLADVGYSGLVTVVYSKAGYGTEQLQVTLPAPQAGQASILVDASQTMSATGPAPGEETGSGYVGGKVYIADGPALGATVTLINLTQDTEVATTTTSIADGAFSFSAVANEADSFELRVSPFDSDADGIFDYVVDPITLGPIASGLGSGGQNLSNLVIVMEMPDKALYFANFVAPLPSALSEGIASGTIINGLEVDSPNATIELHFGAEVDTDTTVVSVFSHLTPPPADAIVSGANVDVVASWDATATILTIDPVFALKTDETEVSGGYEVRLTNWSWKDGSSVGDLALRFSVRVLDAPSTPLTSPTPSIDFSLLGTDSQPADSLACDGRVCWLLDADGFVVFDSDRNSGSEFIWQSSGSNPTSDSYVAINGLPLTWPSVEGAESYRVYARQDNTFDEDDYAWSPGEGWNVVIDSVTQPQFSVPGAGVQVTVDGVLSDDLPSQLGLLDMGLSNDGEQLHPFAYDNQVHIAVTAIDAAGVESTIDESKVITLTDTYNAGLEFATSVTSGENLGGALGVKTSFDLHFSEWMDAQFAFTWQVSSGRVISSSAPAVNDWAMQASDSVPSGSPAGGVLRAEDLSFDFKNSCSVLVSETTGASNVLNVASGMLFAGLGGEDIFFLNGSNPTALALNAVAVLETIDTSTGVITMVNTLETYGGSTLPAGTYVCRTSTNALQGSAFAVSVEAGSSSIDLDDSIAGFHLNQDILLFGTVGGVSLEKRTIIGMSPVFLGPGGVPLGSARLHLDFPVGQTATLVTVFGQPSVDPTWRKASAFTLEADHDPTQTGVLALEHSTVEGSSVMVGDLLLIDLDGVWFTTDDRHVARISEITVTPEDPATDVTEAQAEMEIVSNVGAPTALPFGVTLDPATTLILHLADSFQLSGGSDTSQNFGLRPEADQFSFCDASGTAWCRTNFSSAGQAGTVTY